MGSDSSESDLPGDLVDGVLDELERGITPDLGELASRYPNHEKTVRRLVNAASRYHAFVSDLPTEPFDVSMLEPGQMLGEFEIESLLARGGMGVVYRAHQRSLGNRLVALKVLPSEGQTEEARHRFQREAKAAAALRHENLASVYAFGEQEEALYYAMELVEGPSLRDVLDRLARNLDEGQDPGIRRILVRQVAEVASALATVHRAGLLHRDVKPGNIVIRGAQAGGFPTGPAVLVDFGLVRSADPDVATASPVSPATVAYASREQLLGELVDARADVFSLGVTLHDLLSARLPADRPQASSGLEPLAETATGVDRDLNAVVRKATDPAKMWRHGDAGALYADLEAWLEGRPVSARRLGALEASVRWIRHHPLIFLRRMALLLLIAVASAPFLWAAAWATGKIWDTRAAYEEGQILRLGQNFEALPAVLVPFLPGADLQEAARGFQRAPTEDPLAKVYRLLERGDAGAALLSVAVHLERDGLHNHPALSRYLLRALEESLESPAAPKSQPRALALVARLFHERPDETPEAAEASEPFRSVLQAVAEADPTNLDRIDVIPALSGCGSPDSLRLLVDWMAAQGRERDRCRVAICAMDRILRRADACETEDQLQLEGLARLRAYVVSYLVQIDVPSESSPPPIIVNGRDLIAAIAHAQRRLGRESSPTDLRSYLQPTERDISRGGMLPEERRPAKESQLGAIPASDATPSEMLFRSRKPGVVERDLFAEWDFRGADELKTVVFNVLAAPLGTRLVEFQRHPTPQESLVEMKVFGSSRVDLKFSITSELRATQMNLELVHLKRARQALPFKGVATLYISLDDVELNGRYSVFGEGFNYEHPDVITLPEDLLLEGDHTLSIGLTAEATTTYSLRRVRLVFVGGEEE